jgi:hypothetical protein
MTNTPFIHPNAPHKLVAKFKKADCKYHVLADQLNVNVFLVHRLIKHGIEPNDATEHSREIRARLFLPRRKRQPAASPETATRTPEPDYMKWWKKQDRETIIKQLFENNKNQNK